MPDTYTPTTTDLLRFAVQHDHPTFGRGWFFSPDAIESYGAEVAAKALSDAAYACFGYQPRITSNQAACEFLSARAARLSSGGER